MVRLRLPHLYCLEEVVIAQVQDSKNVLFCFVLLSAWLCRKRDCAGQARYTIIRVISTRQRQLQQQRQQQPASRMPDLGGVRARGFCRREERSEIQCGPLVRSTDVRSTRLYGQFLAGPKRNGHFISEKARLKVRNARLYGQFCSIWPKFYEENGIIWR